MYERFTDRARKVMQLANQEAQRFNHEYIGTEHILLGRVKEGAGVAANVLKNLDIDLRKIRLEIEKIVRSGPDMVSMGKLPQTPRAKKVIEYAIEESRNLNHDYIGTEHLLLGLLREQEGVAAQVLMNLGLKLEDVRAEVLNLLGHDIRSLPGETRVPAPGPKENPTLDRFCLDLTQQAKDGRLGPIVGRQEEMEHILMVLGCRTQNSPILVGPPGVGKSAIVKGLAIRSASGDWPETLRGRRFLAFNLVHMIGLTLEHGNFVESFEALVKELRGIYKPVILFIDDLQTLTGVGSTRSSQYAFCALRSGLARGEFQCITLATPERYQSEVATDSILARHLQPVFAKPLSPDETLKVLIAKRDVYESHHRAEYKDDSLTAAIELSELHLPDRCLPGKALRVLDQAGALVRLRQASPAPELKDLETQMARLTREKEEAVAEQDFNTAAFKRDQADQLKKQQDALIKEWNRKAFDVAVKVDKETVAEVIRKMSGLQP